MDDTLNNDLDDLIDNVIEDGDLQVIEAPRGIGIRACLGELTMIETPDGEVQRLFIQFYAESIIPGAPSDLESGYTQDDVTTTQGVIVADVASTIHPPSYVGTTLPVDVFLDKYVTDPLLVRKIQELMQHLCEKSTPSEEWLENLSGFYHDRLPGRNSLQSPQRLC
jgi:hypothetical protein